MRTRIKMKIARAYSDVPRAARNRLHHRPDQVARCGQGRHWDEGKGDRASDYLLGHQIRREKLKKGRRRYAASKPRCWCGRVSVGCYSAHACRAALAQGVA